MSMRQISHNAPMRVQSGREFAQIAVASLSGYSGSEVMCDGNPAAGGSSKPLSAFCQHRYPSPCRSAFTHSRPTYPSDYVFPDLATNRYMWFMWLELARECVTLCSRSKEQEGYLLCSRNPGSSRRSQPSVLLAVSTMTQNARLLAQALAVSLAKRSATTTVLKARLAAQSSARWQTISKTTQRKLTEFERRRGLSPAAFFV